MNKQQLLFYILELEGTFVFAMSGATASKQHGLDLFGIIAIAFIVACGGGIIRDVCIGSIPPAGLKNWYYLVTSTVASGITIALYSFIQRLKHPVLFFDAIGLSIFAVTGAQKALLYSQNAEVAILLGTTTAVGGGLLRDVLLKRIPVILRKEIYASAAVVACIIVVLGNHFKWISSGWVSIIAVSTCFLLRILSLRYKWHLNFFFTKKSNH
ncbi:hypothetical protein MYP_4338 [Sporocytophaga myxococcoides]|uniref:Glycine transporter domain-containing protein n=1 Tax=Sporocytophaga myxococcoides TaxID=153721 RepID=A0A098LLS9_9BACT|nr:trimeric intracellular cation channel family protein [Sporocytophaga myxococcoides]GAL87108.1 hypothetical protein MYP_4338 [Sporocytophaga myxococcoides]